MENSQLIKNMGDFYINCPHCDEIVYITKVKCGLFLHAANKKNMKPLNPHSKKYQIDKLKNSGMMLGCGGKFSIIINNGELISVKTN
jgi:hypothetical protein